MDPNPHDAASRRTWSSIEVPAVHGIMNARSRACGVGPGRRSTVDRVDRLLLERASRCGNCTSGQLRPLGGHRLSV
jgi:hypothetical protein